MNSKKQILLFFLTRFQTVLHLPSQRKRVYFDREQVGEKNHIHATDFSAEGDARDELVERMKRENCLPKRMLYVRKNDGTALAIGFCQIARGVVLVDWRSDFVYDERLGETSADGREPFEQKSDGFGGVEFGLWRQGRKRLAALPL
jgi:hypothetical protein